MAKTQHWVPNWKICILTVTVQILTSEVGISNLPIFQPSPQTELQVPCDSYHGGPVWMVLQSLSDKDFRAKTLHTHWKRLKYISRIKRNEANLHSKEHYSESLLRKQTPVIEFKAPSTKQEPISLNHFFRSTPLFWSSHTFLPSVFKITDNC